MGLNNTTKKFVWTDLTSDNAAAALKFYTEVLGWEHEEHDMGDYVDYIIIDPVTKESFTGICYKKGVNSNIPNVWLNYVNVENIDQTIELCIKSNGKIIDGPRKMGEGKFAIMQDPTGAYLGIYQEQE